MKKLIALTLFTGLAMAALNFYGNQSLEGLHATRLFSAPAPAYYFIKGYLTLPQGSLNGAQGFSQVGATVSKNGTTVIYQGVSGASGFSINQVSLVTGDRVNVELRSDAAIDQGLNVIKGQVYYGNAF